MAAPSVRSSAVASSEISALTSASAKRSTTHCHADRVGRVVGCVVAASPSSPDDRGQTTFVVSAAIAHAHATISAARGCHWLELDPPALVISLPLYLYRRIHHTVA